MLFFIASAHAAVKLEPAALKLTVGDADQVKVSGADSTGAKWTSSDTRVAQVFGNGFVVGIKPGTARVSAQIGNSSGMCTVSVTKAQQKLVDINSIKQFDDNRMFKVEGRVCYGSELNGRRAVSDEERKFTDSNRVINPNPLSPEKPLEWAVEEGTEIFDGCGVLMGTVAPKREVNGKKIPISMFNFGMSKIIDGRVCIYAFAAKIQPDARILGQVDQSQMEDGNVGISAWLPLDGVIDKNVLIERIGLGKVKLPALALDTKGFRITGGDPKTYMTEHGEMRIVKDPDADPVPSHYLRRPSGTVNIIYSVPGFGLGGQGMDSILVANNALFYPAKGAKVFVQPTYFPGKHPRAGEVTDKTMTFIYGAVKVRESDTVYGWVSKEALATGK